MSNEKPGDRPLVDQNGRPLKRPFAAGKRPKSEDQYKMRVVRKKRD
jgi:hypothetical protein